MAAERSSIQDMFPGAYAAASLMVVGRRIILESQKEPPFFPNIEDLATRMWEESGVDFWSVPDLQKQIIAERSKAITPLLFKRAELQEKYSLHPETAKRNLIAMINAQIDPNINLDPNNINVVWGMFSFGIEINTTDFEKLVKYLTPFEKITTPLGFVTGRLMGDLGPIPLIQKGKESKSTLFHEDLHVLQASLGYLTGANLMEMAAEPEFLRILEGKDIREGDFQKAKTFLQAVATEADADLFIEFQTAIWEGMSPSSNILDNQKFGFVEAALGAMNNVIYHPTSHLSDQEQVEECFNAQRSLNKINEKRALLSMYAITARQEYKGPLPKNEWVAALAFVIPPNTPIEMIKAIMLGGRHKELEEPLERSVFADLAGAIATFARKKINPLAWGSGDALKRDEVSRFVDIVSEIFNSPVLIGNLIREQKITDDEIESAKERIIIYAKRSAPQGMKGKIERELKARFGKS